ncbi:MAG: LytTR family transcriptional regulator [Bacteroidales bacterium]|nr:LytTR family transcriptional regulator [Bacteroidales bacterium]
MSSLKLELGRLLIMSFGVFLFILFFQPFPLEMLDYNNRLLFVTGFGAITFLVTFIILILVPLLLPKLFAITDWEFGPPLGLSLLFMVFTSASFAFYIRYVGKVNMSLYIIFKVALVNLLPLVTLIILYRYKSLKHAVGIFQEQNKEYLAKIEGYENNWGENEIDILSENKSDKLNLKYKDIVYIKSADNYIEICYMGNGVVEKKLLRSTLRNIESQLVHQRNFLRCHRTSIVNMIYLDKLVRSYGSYSLKLNCCDDTVPVSRQYLMQVKVAITDFE